MRQGWLIGAAAGATAALVAAAFFAKAPVASGEDAGKATYIGSEACKKCHMKQYLSWKKTPMAQAFEVLKPDQAVDKKTAAKLDPKVDYTKDAKCLKCHTTGYGTEIGYPAVVEGKAFTDDETARAKLTEGGVCEACHGAGSVYAPYKKDNKQYKRSEVVKRGLLTPPKNEQCVTCHTPGCPTMAPDYKFDIEDAKKTKADKIHEKVPLKDNHDG